MKIFVFIFVSVLMGGEAMVGYLRSRKIDKAWKQAAQELNFNYKNDSFGSTRKMTGSYEGKQLTIRIKTRGGGKHQQSFTVFETELDVEVPDGLKLGQESFMNKLGQFLTGSDIEVGNQEFDELVAVAGENPDQIKDFLSPRRIRVLKRLFDNYEWSKLEEGKLVMEKLGAITNTQDLLNKLERYVHYVRVIEGNETPEEDESEQSLDEALESRKSGDITSARSKLDDSLESEPNNVEALVQVAHIQYMDGRYQKAIENCERALQIEPEDRKAREWLRKSMEKNGASEKQILKKIAGFEHEIEPEEMEPEAPDSADDKRFSSKTPEVNNENSDSAVANTTAEQAEEQAETDMGNSEVSGLSRKEVARNLFDPSIPSYEATDYFEDKYEGRTVKWEGELTNVEDLTFDNVFETEEGVKLTMVLRSGDRDEMIKKDCQLVACISNKTEDSYKTGQQIDVSGTLHQFDGFMRNLYLSDGQVINKS